MKKLRIWLCAVAILILSTLALAGCGIRVVRRIEVKDGVELETEIGSIDFSDVVIVVHYSDKTTEEVPMTEDMIPSSERIKLYKVGEQEIKLSYRDTSCILKINVSRKNFSQDLAMLDDTVTYDGKAHSLTVLGNIPSQATVAYPTGNSFVNAGTYQVTAVVACEGFETQELHATLTINKADYDTSKIVVKDKDFVYDGTSKVIVPENVPSDLKVTYSFFTAEDQIKVDTPFVAGSYYELIKFTCMDENYNAIPSKRVNLNILRAKYDLSAVRFESAKVLYDAEEHHLNVLNPTVLPRGVEVSYVYYRFPVDVTIDLNTVELDESRIVETPVNAGQYVTVAKYEASNVNFEEIPDMRALLTIQQQTVTLGYMRLDSDSCDFDGTAHSLILLGELPDTIDAHFTYNGEDVTEVKRAGVYNVRVDFTYNEDGKDPESYNLIPSSLTAILNVNRISQEITFETSYFSYQDMAFSGKPKYAIPKNVLPEDVTYEVEFKEGDVVVPATELKRDVTYTYQVNFFFADADKEASVDRNPARGTIYFKPAVRLAKFTMDDQEFIYDGEPKYLTANVIGANVPDDFMVYTNNGQTESGEYFVKATINDEKYDVLWTIGVLDALLEVEAKMTIHRASTSLPFTANNIEYFDASTSDMYRIVNFDTRDYNYKIQFTKDDNEVSAKDLQRGETYDFTIDFSYKNTDYDKNHCIESITGSKRFNLRLDREEVLVHDVVLFYDGTAHDVWMEPVGFEGAFYYTCDEIEGTHDKIVVTEIGTYHCQIFCDVENFDFIGELNEDSFIIEVRDGIPEEYLETQTVLYDGKAHSFSLDGYVPPVGSSLSIQYYKKGTTYPEMTYVTAAGLYDVKFTMSCASGSTVTQYAKMQIVNLTIPEGLKPDGSGSGDKALVDYQVGGQYVDLSEFFPENVDAYSMDFVEDCGIYTMDFIIIDWTAGFETFVLPLKFYIVPNKANFKLVRETGDTTAKLVANHIGADLTYSATFKEQAMVVLPGGERYLPVSLENIKKGEEYLAQISISFKDGFSFIISAKYVCE